MSPAKHKISKQAKLKLLDELEQLLSRLSIPIRYERGDFRGGLCTYNDQTYFIVNKKLTVDQKLQIFRSNLQFLNLDDVYIRPALRQFLELEE